VKVPVRGPSGFVSVVLKVPFGGAVKVIELVMVVAVPDAGVALIQ
jgi:hypothetical protein